MQNMRRVLKQPVSLRMADGGMFDSIKRAVGMGPPETISQKYARQDAERAGRTQAPAATVQQAAPAAGIGGYVANSALQRREAAAGLRDGGELRTGHGGAVPGTGTGDKIPAAYEPGEFVVSNAMLKKAPGLRDQLHSLRTDVLADKGMTPAEADAKAVKPGGLGLREGGIPGIAVKERAMTAADNLAFGRQAGIAVSEVPMSADQARTFKTPGEAAYGDRVNPKPMPDGRYGAPANPTMPAATPGTAAPKPSGFAYKAGKALTAVAPALQTAARVAGAASTVGAFGDYTIDDPGVDSSAAGTVNALRAGDFGAVGRSLSKGALETGMDLGSKLADTADMFVPGKMASESYRNVLRGQFGDQLGGKMGRPSATPDQAQPVAPGQPGQPATPFQDSAALPAQDPGRLALYSQDSSRVTLRGQSGTSVDGAAGVSKFKTADGRTLYSNVAGSDNDKLMSNNPGVSTVPGMSREAIDQALGGMSASQVSAENAIRAANLRDGIDVNWGTAAGQAAEAKRQQQLLASSPLGTPGRAFAQKQLLAQEQEMTARRGQDITAAGDQSASRSASMKLRQDQFNSDRTFAESQRVSDRTAAAGRADAAALQDDKRADNQRAVPKVFAERISTMVPTGPDGKPDGAAAASIVNGANAFLADKQREVQAVLAKDPSNARALQVQKELERGLEGMDEDTIRTLVVGQKANAAIRADDGWRITGSSNAKNTDRPVTSLRKENNLILPDQYVTDNGQRLSKGALRDNPDLQRLVRN